jgi:hypothetical protein
LLKKYKMPEFIHNYNFNSFYICLLLLIYNISTTNYQYITIILNKIYLLNYTSFILLINIIGLYLFLKNLSFEINMKMVYKI